VYYSNGGRYYYSSNCSSCVTAKPVESKSEGAEKATEEKAEKLPAPETKAEETKSAEKPADGKDI
jgi:hypothetical protein